MKGSGGPFAVLVVHFEQPEVVHTAASLALAVARVSTAVLATITARLAGRVAAHHRAVRVDGACGEDGRVGEEGTVATGLNVCIG